MHIYDFPDDPNEPMFTLEEMLSGDTEKFIDWSQPRYSLPVCSSSKVKIVKSGKINSPVWKITVDTKPLNIMENNIMKLKQALA